MVAFWQGLGLPGLVDVHVHFLPPRVLAAVWAYFERPRSTTASPGRSATGTPATTSGSTCCARFGVRAFPALAYPHKPGMASFLNDWTLDLAGRIPDCVPSATFFPEPEAGGYVRSALDRGARIAKAHLQVGGYDPNDPLLDPVWGALAEAGTPAVVHCGNGPRRGAHTGIEPMEAVLRRFPGLVLVVAHAGRRTTWSSPRWPAGGRGCTWTPRWSVTPFTEQTAPMPAGYRSRLADLADRVAARHRLPEHPVPVPDPAGRAGRPRPRRRLAARGLLRQRDPAARARGPPAGRCARG